MNTQHLLLKLQHLGMTEREAIIYLSLLKLGQATAYKVGKIAGMRVSSTYVILEKLHADGFVLKTPGTKKITFSARKPQELLSDFRAKVNEFEDIIPLLQREAQNNPISDTLIFSGYDGIAEALNYRYDTTCRTSTACLYSSIPSNDPKLLSLYTTWDRKAITDGAIFTIILPKTRDIVKFTEIVPEKYENSRYIDPKYYFIESAIEIIGTAFVRIISHEKKTATIIDDVHTAQTMRQIFTLIYDNISQPW